MDNGFLRVENKHLQWPFFPWNNTHIFQQRTPPTPPRFPPLPAPFNGSASHLPLTSHLLIHWFLVLTLCNSQTLQFLQLLDYFIAPTFTDLASFLGMPIPPLQNHSMVTSSPKHFLTPFIAMKLATPYCLGPLYPAYTYILEPMIYITLASSIFSSRL